MPKIWSKLANNEWVQLPFIMPFFTLQGHCFLKMGLKKDARHETQYSLDFAEIEMDLYAGIGICREFMKVVDVLIK